MTVKQAIREAIKEGDISPIVARTLQDRGGTEGPIIAQVAAALEPLLDRAAAERPTRLTRLGRAVAKTLGSAAPKARSARLQRIAGARSVGIVFVDVADFTHFTAEHGDDAAIKLLLDTGALVSRAVESGKGELVKRLGDGFLLAFPSSSQAVRAAVKLAAGARGEDVATPAARFRIAVHAGNPVVEGEDLLGHDVNVAARLLEHSRPGEVLVSEAAKRGAERRLKSVAFEGRREVAVRGVADKLPVYRAGPR
jgi:adenylate cyclase